MYIIREIINSQKQRAHVKAQFNKFVSEIFNDTSKIKHLDYLMSFNFSSFTKNNISSNKIWQLYKFVGILPVNNMIVLKKVLFKALKRRKITTVHDIVITYNVHIKQLESNINFFKLNFIKFSWLFFSLFALIYSNLLLLLLNLLPIYFFALLAVPDRRYRTNKKYISTRVNIPDYYVLLNTELIADFIRERYNISEEKMPALISHFSAGIYEQDIKCIVKKKRSLKEICQLINDSDLVKKRFLISLFDIAAADKVFSDKEDSYIYYIADLLNIEKHETDKVRNEYIKNGIRENAFKYSQKGASSVSSVYSFYYSKAYKILELEKTATVDEIKKAYRALAMKFHPDKFATKGKKAMDEAEDKFQEIKEAYELIKRLRKIN